eukprot:357473-Chlamydomonas_euryale.AAC.3
MADKAPCMQCTSPILHEDKAYIFALSMKDESTLLNEELSASLHRSCRGCSKQGAGNPEAPGEMVANRGIYVLRSSLGDSSPVDAGHGACQTQTCVAQYAVECLPYAGQGPDEGQLFMEHQGILCQRLSKEHSFGAAGGLASRKNGTMPLL